MKTITLVEIEAALPGLSDPDLLMLADRAIQVARSRHVSGTRTPVDLNEFSGFLKTDIDPLEYQRQVRAEWE
jgi:hypothetical protein